MTLQDMTDLIRIYDIRETLLDTLIGDKEDAGGGLLGDLSCVTDIISRNVSPALKDPESLEEDPYWAILGARDHTCEERAQVLTGEREPWN